MDFSNRQRLVSRLEFVEYADVPYATVSEVVAEDERGQWRVGRRGLCKALNAHRNPFQRLITVKTIQLR